MLLVDAAHGVPEFVNHVIISCGIGFAGIVGAKATQEVRALTAGDTRADYFDSLAKDIDSFRRRKELASNAGDRDWNDVSVDKFSNMLVVPEEVPELESHDDLQAFDRLLLDAPASKRASRNGVRDMRGGSARLPQPTDFVLADEDEENA